MDTIETDQNRQREYPKLVDLQELRHRTEDYVREEPLKAVGWAVGAGVLLAIFPVFRITSGLVRLVFGLAKPVLIFLGAVKLYEEINKR